MEFLVVSIQPFGCKTASLKRLFESEARKKDFTVGRCQLEASLLNQVLHDDYDRFVVTALNEEVHTAGHEAALCFV